LEKRLTFARHGGLTVAYRWDPSIGEPDDLFAPEVSLYAALEFRAEPSADIWTFPIETVAKSERGLDRTRQGDSVTLRWPVREGEAVVAIEPENHSLMSQSIESHPESVSQIPASGVHIE
jgi:hypothetical protein